MPEGVLFFCIGISKFILVKVYYATWFKNVIASEAKQSL